MLTVSYAECYIKALNAECCYAECHYAECRSALNTMGYPTMESYNAGTLALGWLSS
jgi:hypothetical protein